MGTYTSSMGGAGTMKGQLTGVDFRFELTQTVKGCPGTYNGTGTRVGDHIAGSYAGSDCLGNRGKGTFSMAKGGIPEAPAPPPAPTAREGYSTTNTVSDG